jgi:hypothetical protein
MFLCRFLDSLTAASARGMLGSMGGMKDYTPEDIPDFIGR